MERWSIVGRLCQTPIPRMAKAFHRNALQFLLILFLASCRRADSPPATTKIWEEFSGQKAFAHVKQLVDFGPRPPATDAIEKSRNYIDNQLRLFGWSVERQEFTDDTPRGKV